MSAAALKLEGVSFAYGRAPVLEDVDVEIAAGSFVAMIGPNGGGKSTLLRLILGLIEPDTGRVEVLGRSPRRARAEVGYMPQYLHLDTSFPITVEEVVRMGILSGRVPIGWSRSWRARVEAALARVGCARLASESFAQLSGGQRQLVLIARALVSEPRLLLLDEPTANLDPSVQDGFYSLLSELVGETTVILVSHDVGFVSRLARQVVCVNRRVETHAAQAVDGAALAAMFGEEELRLVDHDHGHHH